MRRRLPLLLAMAALLLLAVVVSRGTSSVPHGPGLVFDIRHSLPPTTGVAAPVAPRALPPQTASVLGIGVLIVLFAAGLLLAVAVTIGALLSARRRRRKVRPAAPTAYVDDEAAAVAVAGAALLRGARNALAELRRRPGEPPEDTVQQAWLSLEEAAADSGTERRPEQTSTEFTTALLAAHRVDDTALATLRGRYQRARFAGPGAVTEADAVAALDALARIAADLAAEVPPATQAAQATPEASESR